MTLLSKSWRIQAEGKLPKEPFILCFWHGCMLPVWRYFSNKNAYAVVSMSKDGEILSELLKRWGFSLIRGSSSKGGKEVLNDIQSVCRTNTVLITPDGPRGPERQFKVGAAVAAHKTGVPIVLCGVQIEKAKVFTKSWDKFRLPLPFTTIRLVFSEPEFIPQDADRDAISNYIVSLNNKLNSLY